MSQPSDLGDKSTSLSTGLQSVSCELDSLWNFEQLQCLCHTPSESGGLALCGTQERTQVIRLGGKHPYQLGHLTDSKVLL